MSCPLRFSVRSRPTERRHAAGKRGWRAGEIATVEVPDWGGVGARRLARSGGGLGGSIWEFQPGEPEYVYHFHHGGDELLIVVARRAKAATARWRADAQRGDVVPLPRGPEGVRAISNPSNGVVRVLVVSSNADPDVAEYPETGKIGIITDGKTWEFFRREDAAEHAL